MEIVDPQLLLEEAEVIQGNENKINKRNGMHDCLISMVKIGVLCSAESPRKRMQMRDVVAEMHTIKDLYLGVKIHGDKQVRLQILDEEYAMGRKASTQGDVYSYGILLLEMINGKGPTDDMFKDNLSLHHFAKLALVEGVMEIVDPQLLLEEAEVILGNENQINTRNRMHDCLISTVKISVLCSAESLRKRMQMRDVVAEMHTIKTLSRGHDSPRQTS